MAGQNPIELGLPHREPFVFVDEIVELEPGIAARGRVSFPRDAPFFVGHFPGNPIVPGVLIAEALAQVAGIVAGSVGGDRFLLSALRDMKFPNAVGPEIRIDLHARKAGELGDLHQFDVEARTEFAVVASGRVVLSKSGS